MTIGNKFDEVYKVRKDKLIPGPGAYEFHTLAMKTAPNFSIGTSQRLDQTRTNKTNGIDTDPTAYNPKISMTKTNSPNHKFTSQNRNLQSD